MGGPITRNPDETPDVPDELLELAEQLGWLIAFFCCVTSTDPNDQSSISFAAVIPAIPEIGSLIKLENGAICLVDQVMFVAQSENGLVKMTPNIHAVLKAYIDLAD
jgi:hypothetical protein